MPFGFWFRTIVPIPYIALDRVCRPTVGVFFTLGGCIVSMVSTLGVGTVGFVVRWVVCVVCRTVAGTVGVCTLGGRMAVWLSTVGGVIGVSMFDVVRDLDFPTLAPITPVERSFPILRMVWSISVPGVPGGKDGPPGCGALIVSLISARRRLRRSKADVSGSSQQWGKNSNVLDIRLLLVLGMWHL